MSDAYESPDDKAERLGLQVIRPKNNELFIDIDSPEALEQYSDLLVVLQSFEALQTIVMAPSASPGHFHVTIALYRNVTPEQRLMLQAMLGSDPKRELLGWKQIQMGVPEDSSVFFEAKA